MSRNQIRADKKVLYAKMSTDRDRHFSIATTIEEQNGEKVVVKQPMTNEAKRHLQNMQNKQKDYGSWSSLGVKAKGDAVVTPFLQEKSLGQQAKQAIYEHNVEKVKNLISTVSMLCEKESAATGNRHIVSREMSGRERTEFAQVFGTSQICPELPCIAPANIDLILDNIFEKTENTVSLTANGSLIFRFRWHLSSGVPSMSCTAAIHSWNKTAGCRSF